MNVWRADGHATTEFQSFRKLCILRFTRAQHKRAALISLPKPVYLLHAFRPMLFCDFVQRIKNGHEAVIPDKGSSLPRRPAMTALEMIGHPFNERLVLLAPRRKGEHLGYGCVGINSGRLKKRPDKLESLCCLAGTGRPHKNKLLASLPVGGLNVQYLSRLSRGGRVGFAHKARRIAHVEFQVGTIPE